MTQSPNVPSPESLLEHREWLRAIARCLVADENDVDDVEQRTWLTVLRNRRRIASPRGWLRRIVRSAVVDEHRSTSRRRSREEKSARPESLPPTDHLVALAEAQHVVAKAVTGLPEPYRTTVLLRYFEGLSSLEVADRMGTPLKTVQTRLRRAHALLRDALDREFGDRRAWCLVLLPLGGSRFPAPVGAVAAGALLMAGKMKFVAAAVVVACLAAAWSVIPREPELPHVAASGAAPLEERSATRARPVAAVADAQPSVSAGWTVAVDVVDTAGHPVVGAHVDLTRETPDRVPFEEKLLSDAREPDSVPAPARSAITTRDGAANVNGVAAGDWRLHVAADGFARHEEQVRVDGPVARRRIILLPACVLVGRVLRADGSAAAGAAVLIGPLRALTAPDGSFRIASLRRGTHSLRVRCDSIVHEIGLISVPQVKELTVRLRGGCGLAGRVVDDATGAPVAGAEVAFRSTDYSDLPKMNGVAASAVSDAEGRFTWTDLPPSVPYCFWAMHEGYAAFNVSTYGSNDILPKGFHLAPGLAQTVEIRMTRGGLVTGRVIREDGVPVAGVLVDVLTRSGSPSAMVLTRSEAVVTGADGTFRVLAHLGTGLVRARGRDVRQRDLPEKLWDALRDDAIPAACRVVVAPAAASVIDIVVTPTAKTGTGTLAGTLTSEDGQPVGGIVLEFARSDAAGANPIVTVTDALGAFRIEAVPAGSYSLRESDVRCSVGVTEIVVSESGTCTVHLFRAPETSIAGRVLAADGTPIGGAAIRIAVPQGNGAFPTTATTSVDGSFEIAVLPGREWSLVAEASGFTPCTRAVPVGTNNVVLVLERALTISGTVVDAATGSPIAGVPLHAEPMRPREGYLRRETASDASGRFVMTDLAPDDYRICVGLIQDRFPAGAGEFMRDSVDAVAAGAVDVRVPVTLGLVIAGRVLDERGEPMCQGVVDALVRTKQAATMPGMRPEIACRVRVGADGRLRIAGLAPGEYDLALGEDGHDPGPVRLQRVAAGTSGVVISAEPPQIIEGRLLLEDGSPLPQGNGNVETRWTRPDGTLDVQQIPMIWDTDGRFRTNRLDPAGTYDLVVEIPDRLGAIVHGVRPGTRDLDVIVRTGATIEGCVVDTDGIPVPLNVFVTAQAVGTGDSRIPREPGDRAFARTGIRGKFVIRGLAARPYEIAAGGDPSDFIETRLTEPVTPGADAVEIRVKRGVAVSGRLLDSKGAPLRGGFVQATRQGIGAQTDEEGRFTIRALVAGRYPFFAQIGSRIVDLGEADAPGDSLEFRLRDE